MKWGASSQVRLLWFLMLMSFCLAVVTIALSSLLLTVRGSIVTMVRVSGRRLVLRG